MTRELAPCGTNAAYQRHVANGEDTCGPCKKAHSTHISARNRALTRLGRRYPEAFAQLFEEELAKEGPTR